MQDATVAWEEKIPVRFTVVVNMFLPPWVNDAKVPSKSD